jgi:hypothetical protein
MLEGLTPNTGKTSCKVSDTINDLDHADAQILLDALKDPRWTASSLSKALRARGVILGKDTIRNHTEEDCRCFKN